MSKKKKLVKKKEKIVKSINNNIRSSVRKLNPILKGIVGKKVELAIRDLQFSEKRITSLCVHSKISKKKTIGIIHIHNLISMDSI